MSIGVQEQRTSVSGLPDPDDSNGPNISTFQRLSLSIPIEAKNYSFIWLFLSTSLNLDSPDLFFSTNARPADPPVPQPSGSLEGLPDVAFPTDLWLKDDICVRDVKIKTSVLQELNLSIEKELSSQSPLFEQQVLNYYDKLLTAYRVYDIPVRSSVSSVYTPPEVSLREEDDEDGTSNGEDYVLEDSKSIARTTSNQSSTTSQKTSNSALSGHQPSSATNTPTPSAGANKHSSQTSNKRVSALSREFTSQRKRFLTMLGHEGNPETVPAEEEHKKQQVLNSLLAKSRIYNKIKKHRELSSSMSSNVSSPSSYSNRNSLTTTTTANSSTASRRRGSSNYFASSPDINESRLLQQTPPSPPITLLTKEQKADNRKQKYDYYVQLTKLMDVSQLLVNYALKANASQNPNNLKVIEFIEFLKKKVLKFIIIDISQMLLDYAQLKASSIYSSR
ncbi:uncharacterized protein CANTADRAFT_8287 [Suhomyces tanzawaensis NRRL Y-17324]|uniref:Uncharacterized protein n=1 Tax=Suhomyces tanzawaensis NRRL Y-17324 TaxID=984487 RepID=A0A1E4SCE0_9ASCO|nr:uncharacterized protein CANTADRAFT_8287 [Suhomyces tanzawaensis NRRL Y-17324]ODV77138.1 hypothetical protein CANTADRAFT_8287 [Suhomyces tanzawaensis NRRL Y-17324]